MFLYLFGAAALAFSVSLDAFAASFAYGCNKIKIPILSAMIINLICTASIGLSFLFGSALSQHLPGWVAVGLSFSILLIIGITKLLDSITKSIIRKHSDINKEIKLSLFNFKLILRLYADPEVADVDASLCISSKEAVVLAVSLSLDGFAVGFGAALFGFNIWAIILFSLLANGLALWLGSLLGNKAAKNLRFNISWLAGVILVGLAFMQLL
ncbi:MAG: sporulation membrane protein YtaF [Defluviitaleaceae bacterium]|nr:sporulation membrane protein YtaF [Defluviitaleaceae bacterium]